MHSGSEWSVILNYAPEEVSIIVVPEDVEDESKPSFHICREGRVLCLRMYLQDRYSRIGDYETWPELLHAVKIVLAWEAPGSPTLH